MIARIFPSELKGCVEAIPSKSMAHRLLICAALSKGITKVKCPESNEDIDATVRCLRAMGSNVLRIGDSYLVPQITKGACDKVDFNCGESGTTLRFMMCIAAGMGFRARFDGSDRLFERPLEPLIEVLRDHGMVITRDVNNRIVQSGKAFLEDYKIRGDVSSQYISGLLLMMPLCGGKKLEVTGDFQSKPYVSLTVSAMRNSGINVTEEGNTYKVSGAFALSDTTVEGDWSNAAFFLVSDALSSDVTVSNLRDDSLQGDREILRIIEDFGGEIIRGDGGFKASAQKLSAAEVDASDIPDLVPIIAVLAAYSEGDTVIKGAARLRLKESDRLKTVTDMINSMGGSCEETDDGLIIHGTGGLKGGEVEVSRDHRIVMAATIAATKASAPTVIKGAEAHSKSYPAFFEHMKALGAVIELEEC